MEMVVGYCDKCGTWRSRLYFFEVDYPEDSFLIEGYLCANCCEDQYLLSPPIYVFPGG